MGSYWGGESHLLGRFFIDELVALLQYLGTIAISVPRSFSCIWAQEIAHMVDNLLRSPMLPLLQGALDYEYTRDFGS
jgi:hypothetical protein